MRLVFAALLVLSMVQIQEPPEYPEGVFCTPAGSRVHGIQTADHPCACKNMLMPDDDGCCERPVTNDQACQQWCHEQHCACPKQCITPDNPPTSPVPR